MHYLIQRHFVADENTVLEFARGTDGLLIAADLIREKALPVRLGLKLAIPREKLRGTPEGKKVLSDAFQCRSQLDMIDVFVQEDPMDLGSGTSFRQIFCNPAYLSPKTEADAILNLDMDQFPINSGRRLDAALNLATRVMTEGALIGIGSRDVPVVLGVHTEASDLRAIDEMAHSLCVGDRLRAAHAPKGVTPAYAHFGESTSGFSILNTKHPQYRQLVMDMTQETANADLSGFAADYYFTLRASMLGHIVTGYVPSKLNAFYGTLTRAQELASVERTIISQTKELSKTAVAPLLRALAEPSTTEALACYYPREQVERVIGWKKAAAGLQ